MSFDDNSLFTRQLQEIARSGVDGQAQAERIRSLLELQRQTHLQSLPPDNVLPFSGKRPRLALT